MQTDPQIIALEKLAAEGKLTMGAVLESAGVAPSTWFRWRHKGVEPKLGTLRKVEAAIARGLTQARQA